jgi:prefoldin beta subunit
MADAQADLEQQVSEFYSLQAQLQFVMYQKQQYKVQLEDVDNAMRELARTDGEVYKSAGIIMVKSTKEDAKKELEEKTEITNVRMGSLTKQETLVRDRLEELKKKIEAATKKKL